MEIDFDATEKVSDYVTIPAGTYACRVAEVRPGTTRAGDERWSLRLVVSEGQHIGKQAAWDSVVFSTRGRARARLVFHALGLPATGRVHVDPADLEGRQAFVEVRPVEYTAPGGSTVRRNEVPYDGYRAIPEGTAPEATTPEGTPERAPAGPRAVTPVPGRKRPGRNGKEEAGSNGASEEPGEIPF
jgi:hypothetical protein